MPDPVKKKTSKTKTRKRLFGGTTTITKSSDGSKVKEVKRKDGSLKKIKVRKKPTKKGEKNIKVTQKYDKKGMLRKSKVRDEDGFNTVSKYKKDGTLRKVKRTGFQMGKRGF